MRLCAHFGQTGVTDLNFCKIFCRTGLRLPCLTIVISHTFMFAVLYKVSKLCTSSLIKYTNIVPLSPLADDLSLHYNNTTKGTHSVVRTLMKIWLVLVRRKIHRWQKR